MDRKNVAASSLAVLVLTMFFLFSSTVPVSADQYPPDIQRIKDRGKLIVAMYYRDIKPFMFHDEEDNFVGHDVELARDIARKLDVDIEFNRTPKTFNAIVETVVNHEADVAISLLTANLSRAEKVRFSTPYILLHPTLIVNRLTASKYTFRGPDPLAEIRDTDQKIGEPKGNSYVRIANDLFKNATIVELEDWTKTMAAVERGDVFAVLRDEIGVNNFINDNPQLSIKLKMIVLKHQSDPLAIAVPSDSTHLLDWINIYLEQYHPTISADELMNQYKEHYDKK